MIHCPRCGTANAPSNQNCIGCGSSLQPGFAAGQPPAGSPHAPYGAPGYAPTGGQPGPAPGHSPPGGAPPYAAPQGYGAPPQQAAPAPSPQTGYGSAPGSRADRVSSTGGKLVGVLVSYDADPAGELWPLRAGQLRVGRKDAAEGLAVSIDHPTVSSNHAVLRMDLDAMLFQLEDTQSANGTLLNGKSIAGQGPREVRDGDSVKFGAFNLTLKLFAR